MYVYVQDVNGNPLMPTKRCGKVRHLLETGKAVVVQRNPFMIRLTYETTHYQLPLGIGEDAGGKNIGLSVTTEEKNSREVYAAQVELRDDVSKLLATRRENRRARRNRKTRYRAPRIDNRKTAKGHLAPSIEQKIQTHIKVIEDICKILPITSITVETASFDIQKIKNPDIEGTEYQQGEQLNFWNVREYVLFRDRHTCQCCKGKSKDKILNVHHIESRKTGGSAPNNLITLCETCHNEYHQGKIKLPDRIKRGMKFKDAAFMGIMRWTLYNRLKDMYSDVPVKNTYGYITKNERIRLGLPKEHYVDARCISGHGEAEPLGYYYYQKKVRCHNRQIHKCTINKGGVRKRNQAEYVVHGYHLFDRVKFDVKEYFVFGRRTSGFMDIRDLYGSKVNKGSISCKKIQLLEPHKNYLTERRIQVEA